ncbi:MAG: hypothetical protein HFJ79_00680 [Clostridiales bacterium]|nr:hypothetical protein [Clostridiales bacterium]
MYLKKEEHAMNDDRTYRLGLSDLLEQDLSSYEYYNSLPKEVQDRIAERDIQSLEEMQAYVAKLRAEGTLS